MADAHTGTLTASALISLAVSVTTGIVTFVAGLRAGKNNADRAVMRAAYQELFQHFTDMRSAIERGAPKTWASYKLVGDNYMPLVKAMVGDGRASLLPSVLSGQLSDLEQKTLERGWKYRHGLEASFFPALNELAGVTVEKLEAAVTGRSYREVRAGYIPLDPAGFSENLFRDGTGIGLVLAFASNNAPSIYVYPDKLKPGTDLGSFCVEVGALASAADIIQVRDELKDADRELQAVLDVLAMRIKDPHPLYETLRETVRELFPGLKRARLAPH